MFLSFCSLVIKPASNKLGILEEDDEFEEFPVEGKPVNFYILFFSFIFLFRLGRRSHCQ
jgi:hypothetical protein